jgi:hypothetical protein
MRQSQCVRSDLATGSFGSERQASYSRRLGDEIRSYLDEPADQKTSRPRRQLSNAKDLLTLRVAPPAAANWASRDGSARLARAVLLEDDAVTLHKG